LEYRELYSAIFYDFHLFDKLYGLESVDPEKINELLKLMQIQNKTEFKDNGFTKLDLSTGQRKRLALIVTFLEDKPIYIFDEWAADQDPQFKKYFYDELLKKLKAEGKTVLAVSHDDRYFHLADRVIKMEFGKIV
jgi:putative ATP-binding cassette transporter